MAKRKHCSALEAAKFIQQQTTTLGGRSQMICRAGIYYSYSDGVWNPVDEKEISNRIMRQIQVNKALNHLATVSGLRNVVANFASLHQAPPELSSPCLMDEPDKKVSFLNLQNGYLDLEAYLKTGEMDLIPHDPKYFITTQLPVKLEPDNKAIEFHKILIDILKDEESRNALQEFVGYCLLPSCKFQRFLVLVGEGANGKSVIVCIIRSLFGKKNISGASLQAMSSSRVFGMGGMLDKQINIDEDLSDLEHSAEANLKKIVSGDLISIEQKYSDPVDVILLLKLIFCANVFPRISDKSNGFWRRPLIINFLEKFSPDRARPELKTEEYWINSGELPGILNWALEGLKRLSDRGFFVEPSGSMQIKNEFREDSNPALIFFRDHLLECSGSTTSTQEIYRSYAHWAHENGYKPKSAQSFAKELKRRFPGVTLTDNPIAFFRSDGGPFAPSSLKISYKSRGWVGLKLVDLLP